LSVTGGARISKRRFGGMRGIQRLGIIVPESATRCAGEG
jgi:hypothetical protein